MSLSYAILGLLGEKPMSGYELVQEFDVSKSVHWPAPQNEIYRELAKLKAAGEIEVEETVGPRGRRRYRLLEPGKARLDAWLGDEETDFVLRYEPFLKAVFVSRLSPEKRRARLERELELFRGQLTIIEEAEARSVKRTDGDPRRYGRRQALAFYRSMVDWSLSELSEMERKKTGGRSAKRRAAGAS